MTHTYTIYTILWQERLAGPFRRVETRRRSNAAKAALHRALYDMTAANGMLDTRRAWEIMGAYRSFVVAPPDHGYMRTGTFSLYADSPVPCVHFEAMRVTK